MSLPKFTRSCAAGAAVAVLLLVGTSHATVVPLGTNSGWQASYDSGLDSFVQISTDNQDSTTLFLAINKQFTKSRSRRHRHADPVHVHPDWPVHDHQLRHR